MIKESAVVFVRHISNYFNPSVSPYYLIIIFSSFCLTKSSVYGYEESSWLFVYVPSLAVLATFAIKSTRCKVQYRKEIYSKHKNFTVSISLSIIFLSLYIAMRYLKIDIMDPDHPPFRNWMFWVIYIYCLLYLIFNLFLFFSDRKPSVDTESFDIVSNMIVTNIALMAATLNTATLCEKYSQAPSNEFVHLLDNNVYFPVLLTSLTFYLLFMLCFSYYATTYLFFYKK